MLKYAVTVGVAGAMAITAASPSLASARKHRSHDYSGRAAAAMGDARGFLPGYIAAPNACVTDDGYGRFQPCDAGGGN